MIQLLTTFASESAEAAGGIAKLGINGKALLIQLITFGLVYVVLRKFAFAKILSVLQQRRETIESGVKLGEDMQKEKAALDSKIKDALADARKQADSIIADANDAATSTVRASEEKAQTKADNIISEAHARSKQDAHRVRKQMEHEVVALIAEATEAIIDEKLDEKKDAALISRVLKEQSA